jgi:hypothetical protein
MKTDESSKADVDVIAEVQAKRLPEPALNEEDNNAINIMDSSPDDFGAGPLMM